MSELLRCPFCGSEAYHYQDSSGISVEDMSIKPGAMHFIMCTQCSALVSGNSKTNAMAAWNKRTGGNDIGKVLKGLQILQARDGEGCDPSLCDGECPYSFDHRGRCTDVILGDAHAIIQKLAKILEE